MKEDQKARLIGKSDRGLCFLIEVECSCKRIVKFPESLKWQPCQPGSEVKYQCLCGSFIGVKSLRVYKREGIKPDTGPNPHHLKPGRHLLLLRTGKWEFDDFNADNLRFSARRIYEIAAAYPLECLEESLNNWQPIQADEVLSQVLPGNCDKTQAQSDSSDCETEELDLTQFEGHSEGPWFMDSVDTPFQLAYGECIGGEDSGVREVFGLDGEPRIATLYPITVDGTKLYQNANARLIAAAPKLLAEVEVLRAERDENGARIAELEAENEKMRPWFEAAEKAMDSPGVPFQKKMEDDEDA